MSGSDVNTKVITNEKDEKREAPALSSAVDDSAKEKQHQQETGATISQVNEHKPDHGQNYVPGSEDAPDNLAPQALDHFKRGYKERAELREREMSHLNMDFENNHYRGKANVALAPLSIQSSQSSAPWQNQRDCDDKGNASDIQVPPIGIMGFEVNDLVSRLSSPQCSLQEELNSARDISPHSFESGKAITAILSTLAKRKKMGVALSVWQWMQESNINRNVFHFNALISVCEKMKNWQRAIQLLAQMEKEGVKKNEITFSSAISACEKSGNWRKAIELLEQMKSEGIGQTAIAYNAAISACEKGLNPSMAMDIFEKMKRSNIKPTVITYSALISACEKGQQWKLALEVLEEMKSEGHGANVIAYSAAISALSKGQQWEKALELFREIEKSGGRPSVVTYNATMTALEKSLQWERALDLFDEMKYKRLPVTVVSYGSAISACEKGYQWRQCLDFLDEMTQRRIKKNVIIFGAAMSCMEKSCRADIAIELMDRMKIEGVSPNVHIYNSAISACARCGMREKGLQLFEEMKHVGVVHDVVTYNAVLDAVSNNIPLARKLFKEGVERGFYARVSRLGTQWLELDLHFLSLGGGEIVLGWWFEECLVPYLRDSSKLAAVKSIDIVTGYGKTRMRRNRQGDDGMRKRVRAMLRFMNVSEIEQANKGRIHIDKKAFTREVQKNGGRIIFDLEGFRKFRADETTANAKPNMVQVLRREGAPRRISDNGRDHHFCLNGRNERDRYGYNRGVPSFFDHHGQDGRGGCGGQYRGRYMESSEDKRNTKHRDTYRRDDGDGQIFGHAEDSPNLRRNDLRRGSRYDYNEYSSNEYDKIGRRWSRSRSPSRKRRCYGHRSHESNHRGRCNLDEEKYGTDGYLERDNKCLGKSNEYSHREGDKQYPFRRPAASTLGNTRRYHVHRSHNSPGHPHSQPPRHKRRNRYDFECGEDPDCNSSSAAAGNRDRDHSFDSSFHYSSDTREKLSRRYRNGYGEEAPYQKGFAYASHESEGNILEGERSYVVEDHMSRRPRRSNDNELTQSSNKFERRSEKRRCDIMQDSSRNYNMECNFSHREGYQNERSSDHRCGYGK